MRIMKETYGPKVGISNENNEPASNALILLTHIPKCCGTSFRYSVIKPNIPEPLVYVPMNGWRSILRETKDYQFITGHFDAGTENLINPFSPARNRQKFRVVILRNPIDQMISYVAYHKKLSFPLSAELVTGDEVVQFFVDNWQARNLQSRMLSGFILNTLYTHSRLALLEPIILYQAKRNLIHYFDYVGWLEQIDVDMENICRILSFKYVPTHAEVTRTTNRISVEDLSSNQIEQLRSFNYMDVSICKYAESLFANESQ